MKWENPQILTIQLEDPCQRENVSNLIPFYQKVRISNRSPEQKCDATKTTSHGSIAQKLCHVLAMNILNRRRTLHKIWLSLMLRGRCQTKGWTSFSYKTNNKMQTLRDDGDGGTVVTTSIVPSHRFQPWKFWRHSGGWVRWYLEKLLARWLVRRRTCQRKWIN